MKVSLFVTCIIDQMAPQVGVAVVELLEKLGVEVSFNSRQTCCAQPAFNAGYHKEARAVAASTLTLLEYELKRSDYIVVPSGSCASMIKKFYRNLFAEEKAKQAQAEKVGARCFELSQFLVGVLDVRDLGARFRGRVTYHDSCHLKRELNVTHEPRQLIGSVEGVTYIEMDRPDVCCGFGGTFAVRFPEISTALGDEKLESIKRCGADALVACDSGCLLQIAGLAGRHNLKLRCMHLAELLTSSEVL